MPKKQPLVLLLPLSVSSHLSYASLVDLGKDAESKASSWWGKAKGKGEEVKVGRWCYPA